MNAFAVVVALGAVAALGWALSAVARRILRRYGVETDERSGGRRGPDLSPYVLYGSRRTSTG